MLTNVVVATDFAVVCFIVVCIIHSLIINTCMPSRSKGERVADEAPELGRIS